MSVILCVSLSCRSCQFSEVQFITRLCLKKKRATLTYIILSGGMVKHNANNNAE